MNYPRAKLIIWNHRSYSKEVVTKAIACILGTINAAQEDISQACLLVNAVKQPDDNKEQADFWRRYESEQKARIRKNLAKAGIRNPSEQ